MDSTSSANLQHQQALRTLLQNIDTIASQSKHASESLTVFGEFCDSLTLAGNHAFDQYYIAALSEFCRRLANHANDALLNDLDYSANLLSVLAVATKEAPIWRVHFGQSENDHTRYTQCLDAEPDSVLEVARRVLIIRDPLPPSTFQSALRIIANCCADNNVNRKVIIHRDGIRLLLQLIQREIDPDALVLSLYNVCIDYDEPATFLAAEPHTTADVTTAGLNKDALEADEHDTGMPSLAVERLAAAYSLSEECTTFEFLLSLDCKVSDHVQPYLAELVDMATQPALSGFNYIRSDQEEHIEPWAWSFSTDGNIQDTIALMRELSCSECESLIHINGAVLNLLSQKAAVVALLKRADEAVWTLLTLSCPLEGDLDDETAESLWEQRKAILKLLYSITGDSSFHENTSRASVLTKRCTAELKNYLKKHKENDNGHGTQQQRRNSQSFIIASACVILAQLAVSDDVRDNLLQDSHLVETLALLLAFETSPDVLYPTVSIISRLSLTTRTDLPILQTGILSGLQRLLTLKGIGMTVPIETVVAYKTIARNRPEAANSLLVPGLEERTIVADVFMLWNLTTDNGARLEIGKFFLELFRTILPVLQEHELHPVTQECPLLENFKRFLAQFSPHVAKVFVWVCLNAEPTQQRDHGWFGLAMLSFWPEGRTGILSVIEEQQDMRNEILKVSELKGGAVPNNLKLMLSKLLTNSQDKFNAATRNVLQIASENLGLISANQK